MAIFHVTTRGEWDAAQAAGSYRVSTRGATLEQVGFIHASSAEQLPRVASLLYGGAGEQLVVLELDDEAISRSGIRILWEDGGAGELFPHVYGPIEPEAVAAVHPAEFDAADELRWPVREDRA
jgi:uncharacterized protein (DUF952 family)